MKALNIEYNAITKDNMTTETYLRNWCKQMYMEFAILGRPCTYKGQGIRYKASGGSVTHSGLPYEFVTMAGRRYELRCGGKVISKGSFSKLCYKQMYSELVHH
jgi:hypothetical protein